MEISTGETYNIISVMESKPKSLQYEEAMREINEFGKFQKVLIVLLALSTIPNGFFAMAIVFVAQNPQHRCFIPETDGAAVMSAWPQFANYYATEDAFTFNGSLALIPLKENNTMRKYSQCEMFDDRNLTNSKPKKCENGWLFLNDIRKTSIVTEWQLICNRSWIRPLLTAVYMSGVLCGSLVSGSMSDLIGRKPTFLVGTLLQFVFLALSGASNGPVMFGASMFLAGAFAYINYVVAFVISAEVINTRDRVLTGALCVGGFAGGYMLLPLFAYYLPNWRTLTYALSSVGVLFIPYIWLMPESPRWLYTKNKIPKFKILFKKIARTNGIEDEVTDNILRRLLLNPKDSIHSSGLELIPTEKYQKEIEKESTDNDKTIPYSYFDLIRTHKIRYRTINMAIIWWVCSVVYYCLSLNTSNIGGDPYINCFVAAAVEIPAYALTVIFLKFLGRKQVLISTLLVSGISCMCVPYLQRSSTTASIVVAMTGKLSISSSFCIIYIFCSELYPTLLRSRGVGAASMFARIGGMVAPYLLYMGETYHEAPYLFMGSLSLVAATVTSILPETKKSKIPETPSEIESVDYQWMKGFKRILPRC